jgi:hypothetical protein
MIASRIPYNAGCVELWELLSFRWQQTDWHRTGLSLTEERVRGI